MARKSALIIAMLFAFAAVAGALALSRTLDAGASARSTSDRLVAARSSQLDRFERSLRRRLASVPELPSAAQAATPTPQRVIYVRPAPVASSQGGHDDDDMGEQFDDSGGEADD